MFLEGGASPKARDIVGKISFANAINSSGQIVGEAKCKGPSVHAFLWENGEAHDLGTLGGEFSQAYSINTSGQIVGISSCADASRRGFLVEHGKMTDLTASSGTEPCAINASGQILANSLNPSVKIGNSWRNLNMLIPTHLGWHLIEATDINASGQIVVKGISGDKTHALLLTPR